MVFFWLFIKTKEKGRSGSLVDSKEASWGSEAVASGVKLDTTEVRRFFVFLLGVLI